MGSIVYRERDYAICIHTGGREYSEGCMANVRVDDFERKEAGGFYGLSDKRWRCALDH